MFGIHDLTLFILSGLLLNMAPGPDSLLIASHSARWGWRAGSMAALGIGAGTCIHIAAAAFGIAALLAASAEAFSVVKAIGAAYLVYIGVKTLIATRGKPTADAESPASGSLRPSRRKLFMQGFVSNVFNPKIALFFLAFMPQFIDASKGHTTEAFLVLGAVFNINGMLWCHALALTAAFAGRKLRFGQAFSRWINRTVGALFVLLGLRLAFAARR